MKPYLIWSYPYSHASAGPKALHRLCHELNVAGQEAYVGWTGTNPEWNTPSHFGELPPDWIAVYPEIVSGNPWQAPHVARWVLNKPGLLGGDSQYDPAEMVFAWSPLFLEGVPLLQPPTLETDIYFDRHEDRAGALYYVGKGSQTEALDAEPVTVEMRLDRYALADALNRASVLYSFDAVTGMADLARLCGCPVELVPTRERLEADGFAAEYQARVAAFPEQLRRFVEITQGSPA